MAKFNNVYEYIFHLLASILKGTQPEEKPEGVSFDEIFAIGKEHHIANMLYYAVEKLENGPSDELNKEWAKKRDQGIVREFTQSYEYGIVSNLFVKNQVRFLPLKGILLKDLYPQRDMRSMSDIDILVDLENAGKAGAILKRLGYIPNIEEDEDHDGYLKKPHTYFEIHRSLFTHGGENSYILFENAWEHATEVSPYIWHYDKTWFFIYLFAHFEKHYNFSGIGIRAVMDIWVYLNKYGNELDFDYIYSQLEKSGSAQLCRDIIGLTKVWFDGETWNDKYKQMTNYILDCGVYGNNIVKSYNTRQKQGKFRHLIFRIFPSVKTLEPNYPILKKVPFLLPFIWIYRWFAALTFRRKDVKKELDYINSDVK